MIPSPYGGYGSDMHIIICTVASPLVARVETALHCNALHRTALDCTGLHCTVPDCTALHCTALHCTALYCIALHRTALDCTALDCSSPHWTSRRSSSGGGGRNGCRRFRLAGRLRNTPGVRTGGNTVTQSGNKSLVLTRSADIIYTPVLETRRCLDVPVRHPRPSVNYPRPSVNHPRPSVNWGDELPSPVGELPSPVGELPSPIGELPSPVGNSYGRSRT
eukprot:1191587-Prorocentrum_minimum.AAC.2